MSAIESGAIDCDVHVEPPSMDRLLRYLAPYWHEFIRSGYLRVAHRLHPESEPMSARPEARAAGTESETLPTTALTKPHPAIAG